ncbi:putative transcription factor bHLH041 [Citrus sinensis]|nr:putative transcription factor bHLH041 [Citrus sinensis]
MDTAFQLEEAARANFFQSVMQTFGCTYICLWSYSQQSNCLVFLDGWYHEENNQPSSSSASLARSRLPGLAFKNGQQYIEVNAPELQRLAFTESQRQFYQEARIKTAVFMACKSGEIELGLCGGSQGNMEMEMRSLFQEDFKDQQSPAAAGGRPIQSSSSSSLRSLSMDSPSEYSSLLFNIPTSSHLSETLIDVVPNLQPLTTTTTAASTSTSISTTAGNTRTNTSLQQAQQAMEAFAQLQNIQLPIIQETEQDAMTRAILAVLTSPTSSSSSSQQQQQQQQQQEQPQQHLAPPKASAFKNYNLVLAPTSNIRAISAFRGQSILKRTISYYRRLNIARREYTAGPSRPTSTQLHHMISERKRREKLNESFHALRSLLPPGTKKDKASLLINTREYLSSLKAQVDELSRRNQILEAQVLPKAREAAAAASVNAEERVQVRVSPVAESTSEWRMVDIRVIVRGECPALDLVIRILEFLKGDDNLSLISVEANTQIAADSTSFNHVILRLRIQGNEWDESAFEEAVRRVVGDLAH